MDGVLLGANEEILQKRTEIADFKSAYSEMLVLNFFLLSEVSNGRFYLFFGYG